MGYTSNHPTPRKSPRCFTEDVWRIVRPSIDGRFAWKNVYFRLEGVRSIYKDPQTGRYMCEAKAKGQRDWYLELIISPTAWQHLLPIGGSPYELVLEVRLMGGSGSWVADAVSGQSVFRPHAQIQVCFEIPVSRQLLCLGFPIKTYGACLHLRDRCGPPTFPRVPLLTPMLIGTAGVAQGQTTPPSSQVPSPSTSAGTSDATTSGGQVNGVDG